MRRSIKINKANHPGLACQYILGLHVTMTDTCPLKMSQPLANTTGKAFSSGAFFLHKFTDCLLYTSPSPRDRG